MSKVVLISGPKDSGKEDLAKCLERAIQKSNNGIQWVERFSMNDIPRLCADFAMGTIMSETGLKPTDDNALNLTYALNQWMRDNLDEEIFNLDAKTRIEEYEAEYAKFKGNLTIIVEDYDESDIEGLKIYMGKPEDQVGFDIVVGQNADFTEAVNRIIALLETERGDREETTEGALQE